MISFEEEPEETWECPPEGYDDLEDGDCDYLISNSRNLFNRILEAVDQSISIPSLRTQVDQHILREDWKSKHVGLTALSQVGDDMNADELASIIGLVLPLLKHEHVKVRYATLHLIGQISDDAKPDFQARHHLTVLPALMECFEESCPRVLSHVFAALTNFLEGAVPEQTEPYVKALVDVCVKNLENGISIVKEAALSTLAALAQGARSTFEPYFDNLYNLVYEILLNSTGNQYRQLRGQAIETLTLFALGVGPQTFLSYLPELVITIIDIQDNAVDYIGADPQISYVFTGWNRLATIFGKTLTFSLEQFMPGFMKLFQAVLKSFEAYLQATKGKKNADADPNNLYDEEDMCSALEAVNALASELCSDFIQFIPKLEPLVIKCLNTSYYDASAPALKCLPSFFKALQIKYFSSNDKVQAKEKFNHYIKLILKLCYHEGQLDMYPDLARSLKSMVEAGGTLCDESELADLIRKTLKMIDDSIIVVKNLIKDNEVEDEDDAESQINEEIALQEESQEHLVELLGIFFEINKDLSSAIMKEHSASSLPRYFEESDELHSPYIGLYIIYFMLLTLKYDSLADIFDFMCEKITKYLADKDNLVRQCAGSALAAVSKRGHEDFKKYAVGFLAGIKEGLEIPDDGSGSDFILAKDNMTAALGNLIWYQTASITGLGDLSDLWLKNLPIREDKPDGLEQHELLLDRLINPFAELILGKTGGNVLRVMEIFGTILGTEMCNEDIEKKIHIVINLMKMNSVMFEALKQSLLVLPIDMVEKVKKYVLS
jgi:importin-5